MKSKLSSSTTSLGVPFKQRWPFLFKSCTGCGQGARHTFPPTPTSHPFSLSLLLAESSPRYSCPLLFPLWQLMSPKPCSHSLRPFAWLKVFSIFPCDHTGNSASGGGSDVSSGNLPSADGRTPAVGKNSSSETLLILSAPNLLFFGFLTFHPTYALTS